MKRTLTLAAVLAVTALFAAPATAIDVWDQASEDDNTTGTDNGLTHGSNQLHDLGAEVGVADQDWYTFQNTARSSYEVLVDGTTGDMNLSSADVARMGGTTTVLQNSVGLAGYSAVLRWQNSTSSTTNEWIRVFGAACGTTCSVNDQYRIRFFETTYGIPRFNNGGSQVTVLNVASIAPFSCTAAFHFYNTAGTFLGTTSNTFSARELFVLNTASLAFANQQNGSIIVSHTCGYGGLAGKAVALESSTGFTFDTQLVPRID